MNYKSVLLLSALALVILACGGKEITSRWTSEPVKIDGKLDDWEGELIFDKEEMAALGIKNDNDFIYLCVTTKAKTKVMQIFRNGFTVWFEPEDGKTLGLKYPLPKRFDEMGDMSMNRIPRSNEKDRDERGDFPQLKIDFIDQPEFQVVNEDEYPLYQFFVDDTNDYQVKMTYENQQLVYELKIPIGNNHFKFESLNAVAGGKLSLAFETGEMERPSGGMGERPEGMPGGGGMGQMPGGGGRGGMNGGGPGGQGGGPGGQRTSIDNVDFSVDVILAVSK